MSSHITITATTEAPEVVEILKDQIKGKNIIVTGTTVGGLGFEAAKNAAKYAKLVVITGRSEQRLAESKSAIESEYRDAEVRTLVLPLDSLAGVRKAAAQINAYPENFNVLINNAGIMAVPFKLTEEGFEVQYATNHLGHFLFTALIKDKILAAGTQQSPSRIVNVSSGGHHIHGIEWNDFLAKESEHTPDKAYGQGKTANVLFSRGIAQKAKASNAPLLAYSLHPGIIIGTGLSDHFTDEQWRSHGIDPVTKRSDDPRFAPKTIGAGAAVLLVAAFDPSIASQSGAYLSDSAVAEEMCADHAKNLDDAARLWSVSETQVKQKFDL